MQFLTDCSTVLNCICRPVQLVLAIALGETGGGKSEKKYAFDASCAVTQNWDVLAGGTNAGSTLPLKIGPGLPPT